MTFLGLLSRWLGPAPADRSHCAQCDQTIHGPRLQALGRSWHPEHFCCGVCHRPLGGRFLVNFHQEPFCTEHAASACTCEGCGHLTSGGLCRSCSTGILADPGEAAALLTQVQGLLRAQGLPWWPQTFPVRLVGAQELGAGTAGSPRVGEISKLTLTDAQGRLSRVVPEIRLLSGRPKILQGAVLAHELGHGWLFQKGLEGLPHALEEGFCEFCAHLWLGRNGDPRAPYLMARLARNEDPVYGGGFRTVQARVLEVGLPAVLTELGTGGPPSGHVRLCHPHVPPPQKGR